MKKVLYIFAIVMLFGSNSYAANYALAFDGLDDYVSVPDNDSLDLTTGLTIEAWIKPYSYSSGPKVIVSKMSTFSYLFKLHNDGSGKLRAQLSTGTDLRGNTSVSLDEWVHVAMTYDGSSTRFFVNGLSDGLQEKAGSIQKTYDPLYIGSLALGKGGEVFNGLIDEVRIWNYARTQQQLQDWTSYPLFGSEQGLVGYWNFDEGAGNMLGDLTQFENNGQIYGAQWVASDSPVTAPVPEPATIALFGLGGLAMAMVKRKRGK